MGIQDHARAVFAALAAAHPDVVVAVVSGSESGDGIRDTQTALADGAEWGEQGLTTSVVRVSAGDFTEPGKGSTITVAGVDAFVTSARTDPAGALITIEYQNHRPVSGV